MRCGKCAVKIDACVKNARGCAWLEWRAGGQGRQIQMRRRCQRSQHQNEGTWLGDRKSVGLSRANVSPRKNVIGIAVNHTSAKIGEFLDH